MSSENHRTRRNLFQNTRPVRAVQCHNTKIGQFFNCMSIMYNLPKYIDRTRMRRVFSYLASDL